MGVHAGKIRFFFFLHPVTAFIYFIGFFCFLFMFNDPFYLLAVYAGAFVLAFFYCGAARLKAYSKFMLPAAVGILVLNPILIRRGATILFYIAGNPVTLEGAAYGFYNFFLITGAVLVFLSFNAAIPSEKFLFLFAKPLPRTAFVADMSLRLIPHFSERAGELIHVRQTRDSGPEKKRFMDHLRTAGTLLFALMMWNLEEGLETGLALRSKDYGTGKRTLYNRYAFARRDVFWIFITLASGITVAAGFMLGHGVFQIYPRLSIPVLNTGDAVFLPMLIFYASIPFIIEAFYGIRK